MKLHMELEKFGSVKFQIIEFHITSTRLISTHITNKNFQLIKCDFYSYGKIRMNIKHKQPLIYPKKVNRGLSNSK